ncbi:MAG: hypothetical protein ACLQVD_22300, partial [Capsulimonadaceae bacterium]
DMDFPRQGTVNVGSVLAEWMTRGPWLPVVTWLNNASNSTHGFGAPAVTPYGLFTALSIALLTIWTPFVISGAQAIRDRQPARALPGG